MLTFVLQSFIKSKNICWNSKWLFNQLWQQGWYA